MCSTERVSSLMLMLSLVELACGFGSLSLGSVVLALERLSGEKSLPGHASPVWSGIAFIFCGICGLLCAKKRTGLFMILFSSLCICGMIAGILNVQFLQEDSLRRSTVRNSIRLAALTTAAVGIAGCLAASWLTCRMARNEQRRMFFEMEHSLHHSHELTEKELADLNNSGFPSTSTNGKQSPGEG
uniref:Transmembrane protein 196 n=1 Tax=Eptatretus burgeri TaxID=7764 RepID=A0A8C4QEW8_EPTBU